MSWSGSWYYYVLASCIRSWRDTPPLPLLSSHSPREHCWTDCGHCHLRNEPHGYWWNGGQSNVWTLTRWWVYGVIWFRWVYNCYDLCSVFFWHGCPFEFAFLGYGVKRLPGNESRFIKRLRDDLPPLRAFYYHTASIPILTVRLGDKGTKESLYWNFVFRGGHRRFGMPSVLYHQMYSQQGLCLDLRSTSWRNLSSTGTFRDVCQ